MVGKDIKQQHIVSLSREIIVVGQHCGGWGQDLLPALNCMDTSDLMGVFGYKLHTQAYFHG